MTDAAERFLKSLAEALTDEAHVFEYPYPDDPDIGCCGFCGYFARRTRLKRHLDSCPVLAAQKYLEEVAK